MTIWPICHEGKAVVPCKTLLVNGALYFSCSSVLKDGFIPHAMECLPRFEGRLPYLQRLLTRPRWVYWQLLRMEKPAAT